MADEHEETEAELVMPFVTVQSVGGPHDDAAYTAGWQMAVLDASMARLIPAASVRGITVAEDCKAQADLIAMKHGWSVTFRESGIDGYLFMDLAHGSEPEDAEDAP